MTGQRKTRLELKEYLQPDELVDFVKFMARERKRRGSRYAWMNYVIAETLCLSGLRVSELCALKCRDAPPARTDQTILVANGKGGKRRTVDVPADLADDLAEWQAGELDPEAWLFQTRTGRPLRRNNVWVRTQNWLRDWYADRRRKWEAALEKGKDSPEPRAVKFGPHGFRHSYAIRFLTLNGTNDRALAALMRQLGHGDINTTLIYAHTASEDRRAFAEEMRIQ